MVQSLRCKFKLEDLLWRSTWTLPFELVGRATWIFVALDTCPQSGNGQKGLPLLQDLILRSPVEEAKSHCYCCERPKKRTVGSSSNACLRCLAGLVLEGENGQMGQGAKGEGHLGHPSNSYFGQQRMLNHNGQKKGLEDIVPWKEKANLVKVPLDVMFKFCSGWNVRSKRLKEQKADTVSGFLAVTVKTKSLRFWV